MKPSYHAAAADRREHCAAELSVAAHRKLAGRLQSLGIWRSKASCAAFLSERRSRGRRLLRDILRPVLGPADFRYLNSAPAFGIADPGIAAHLPLVLAFGHDMGSGIHSHLGGERRCQPVPAELCALFNCGIVIFDRNCDDCKAGCDRLSRFFDEAMLRRLISDGAAVVDGMERAGSVPVPEIRILLKIVCAFFSRLNEAAGPARGTDAWMRLGDLLTAAYRAEIRSARRDGLDPGAPSLAATVQMKSILPFEVILQIVRVCQCPLGSAEDSETDVLLRRTGMVFALLDDLVDMARDLESGSVNAIIASARGPSDDRQRPTDEQLARRLLEGEHIDRSIDQLSAALMAIVETCRAAAGPAGDARTFVDLVLDYVRSWGD